MNEKSRDDLLEYYFGTISNEKRIEVEDRLLNSKPFLTELIALKRNLELSDDLSIIPSAKVEQRLKESVHQSFSYKGKNSHSILEPFRIRFIGRLAFGAALTALIFVIGIIVFKQNQIPSVQIHEEKAKLVDSAADLTASIHFL